MEEFVKQLERLYEVANLDSEAIRGSEEDCSDVSAKNFELNILFLCVASIICIIGSK